ncbi:MAG: hypothetical protein K0R15_828 [Clostridiales bacterium]|jgi:tRNA(Ile)-lysidine synthase|nr:hypothetical protein [Bacillales bacterium]MDF2820387.1 hypothetical protein [Clostridiales bacterium]
MLDKVYNYIIKNNMISKGDSVIVGISGGADSVCLLLMLIELREKLMITIHCVHINHGVRGLEAKDDENYVIELCEKNNISISIYQYDINEYARENKLSSEEAGRILRYRSFEEELNKTNSNKIAVAHNANDQAETVLLNLFRGTGLTGLTGMQAIRDNIIRPLLCLTREEIEIYCMSKQTEYKTDRTNLEDVYTRNKIRLNVFPYIKNEINEKVIMHINNTARILNEEEEYISYMTDLAFDRICEIKKNEINILVNNFMVEKIAIKRRIIRLAVKKLITKLKDIDLVHIDDICELENKQVGKKICLPHNIVAIRTYDAIVLKKKERNIDSINQICYDIEPGSKITIDDNVAQVEMTLINCELNVNIPKKSYTKWFDYDTIKDKLRFRTRKPGDFIRLAGINGKKKLSDFFIDNKIPSEKRDKILLLAEGNEIIWIAGYRISEKYKVTSATKRILVVEINGRYTLDVQEES